MKKNLLRLVALTVALAFPTGVFAQTTGTETTKETKTTETKTEGGKKKTTTTKKKKSSSKKKSTSTKPAPEPTKAPAK